MCVVNECVCVFVGKDIQCCTCMLVCVRGAGLKGARFGVHGCANGFVCWCWTNGAFVLQWCLRGRDGAGFVLFRDRDLCARLLTPGRVLFPQADQQRRVPRGVRWDAGGVRRGRQGRLQRTRQGRDALTQTV